MHSHNSSVRSRRTRPDVERPLVDLSTATSSSSIRGPSPSNDAFSEAWTNSISAVQDLASSVIGKDTFSAFTSSFTNKKSSKSSKSLTASSPNRRHTTKWGPSGLEHNHIGAGSQEERISRVREAKRIAILDGSYNTRLKRKDSDDIDIETLHRLEAEQDALAYLHTVRPGDTMAGLQIRYNCSAVSIRKANRMWLNDPIQSRKLILIPVEGCSVKGQKVDAPLPQNQKLVADEPIEMHMETETSPTNGWAKDFNLTDTNPSNSIGTVMNATANTYPNKSITSEPTQTSSPTSPTNDSSPEWRHDSWVLLLNDTSPTEIVRLSRQSLSYFPRPRRKSNSYSDQSSARPSLDLFPSLINNTNPSNPMSASTPQSPTRPSHSNSFSSNSPNSTARPNTSRSTRSQPPTRSSSALALALQGPGGVGSLSSRTIGPGTERLSEMIAPRANSFMSPPKHMTAFTPWVPALLESGQATASSVHGSGATGSQGTAGVNLEEVSGAIEMWMRKAYKRVGSALETVGSSRTNSRPGSPMVRGVDGTGINGPSGAGSTGLGDLIEMTDALEMDEGGSGELTPRAGSSTMVNGKTASWATEQSGEIRGRTRGRNTE